MLVSRRDRGRLTGLEAVPIGKFGHSGTLARDEAVTPMTPEGHIRVLRRLRAALMAALLTMAAAAASAQNETSDVEPATSEADPALEYEVRFEGELEDELLELLRRASLLVSLQEKSPASRAALEKRARADLERLDTALRSEGYYDARLEYDLDTSASPFVVVIIIDTGVLYLLADFAIHYANARPGSLRPGDLEEIGLHVGMAARAPAIRNAERRLLRRLAEVGFPFAEVKDRKIIVDHDETTLSVTLDVDAGPYVTFGTTEVEGVDDVEPDYIRRLLTWRAGEPYDQRKVDASLAALRGTNLFAAVSIDPRQKPAGDGAVEMRVRVEERAARSIGGGLTWSTAEGFLSELFWEHRNLFGRDETLRLTGRVGELEQGVGARLSKPHFVHLDQTGTAELQAKNRETDAFDERSLAASLGLERRSKGIWRTGVGGTLEYLDIDETDEPSSRRFLLFSLPVSVTRDTSDDPLDASEGSRVTLGLAPSLGTIEENIYFLTASATASAYHAFDDDRRFVLAGRLKLGSILSVEAADIPASKRFFAGGGGSVRGYEFQSIGPLDAEDDPIGGRSLIETNLELRIKLTETIGLVPFVDGGAVYREVWPSADEDFQVAAGLGFRYFTEFVPIRLDIAFPVNPRGIDDAFQFYISLGQAF